MDSLCVFLMEMDCYDNVVNLFCTEFLCAQPQCMRVRTLVRLHSLLFLIRWWFWSGLCWWVKTWHIDWNASILASGHSKKLCFTCFKLILCTCIVPSCQLPSLPYYCVTCQRMTCVNCPRWIKSGKEVDAEFKKVIELSFNFLCPAWIRNAHKTKQEDTDLSVLMLTSAVTNANPHPQCVSQSLALRSLLSLH